MACNQACNSCTQIRLIPITSRTLRTSCSTKPPTCAILFIALPGSIIQTRAYETFSNYNVLNQAFTHRVTSGGSENFIYDTRGLKQSFTNAVGKTTNYFYDGLDRLSAVKDPRGFQTDFEHNLRGEVTKITNPPDAISGVRYYTTNHYNALRHLGHGNR